MEFPQGIRAFKPNEKAPDFVKANLVINGEFMEWYQNNNNGGEVRLDLKESKNGKYYLAKNEYTPGNSSLQG